MRRLEISHDALKFFEGLDAKQYRQVGRKMFALLSNPQPNDASQLKGSALWRADIGEYRIAYSFDDTAVTVAVIGKRNDDEVYRKL